MKRWNKHVKVAVAAMVTAVAVMTPAVGLAAGNATLKKYCMEEANLIALQLNIPGEGHMTPAHVLAATENSMEIRIYPGVRKVTVIGKQPGVYETATTSY